MEQTNNTKNTKPAGKKVANIIKKTISIICITAGMLFLVMIVNQQFFSVDALYARDNLGFFMSELTGKPMKKYPYPMIITINKLIKCKTYYQMIWDVEKEAALPDEEYENPLNVLVLDANNEDIQTIYNEFRYSAAVMNMSRKGLVTQDAIKEWDQYATAANTAYKNLIKDLAVTLFTSILILSFGICLLIYEPLITNKKTMAKKYPPKTYKPKGQQNT